MDGFFSTAMPSYHIGASNGLQFINGEIANGAVEDTVYIVKEGQDRWRICAIHESRKSRYVAKEYTDFIDVLRFYGGSESQFFDNLSENNFMILWVNQSKNVL